MTEQPFALQAMQFWLEPVLAGLIDRTDRVIQVHTRLGWKAGGLASSSRRREPVCHVYNPPGASVSDLAVFRITVACQRKPSGTIAIDREDRAKSEVGQPQPVRELLIGRQRGCVGQLAKRALMILEEQAEEASKHQCECKAMLVNDLAALRSSELEPGKRLIGIPEDQQVPARMDRGHRDRIPTAKRAELPMSGRVGTCSAHD